MVKNTHSVQLSEYFIRIFNFQAAPRFQHTILYKTVKIIRKKVN